jgi:hypothetical protein
VEVPLEIEGGTSLHPLVLLEDEAEPAVGGHPARRGFEVAVERALLRELRLLSADGWQAAGRTGALALLRSGAFRVEVDGCLLTGYRVRYWAVTVCLRRPLLTAAFPSPAGRGRLPHPR